MYKRLLVIVLAFLPKLFFSQSIERIEFESFNAIIIGSRISIDFVPLKNNKKGKIKVYFANKDHYFTKKISREKYIKICNDIVNIPDVPYTRRHNDTIMIYNCIDGSSTYITTFQNNIKKQYFLDCISSKDKNDEKRKYFWKATKLILETVKKRIEDIY